MKRILSAAIVASAAIGAHAQTSTTSPAKKELVQKLIQLQQPDIEGVARGLVERPAGQMMQEVSMVLQRQIPAEKREAVGKTVETEIRKFVDETVPLVRERAMKLAPSTIGAVYEEKFTEDELKQLIAWVSSPLNKKYVQLAPEIRNGFVQKLVAESQPAVEPKVVALDARIRTALGLPPPAAQGASGPRPAAPAPTAAPAASRPKGR
ncbi:DUF2059 domain-containing protein [Piscinibacter koreensis]|uniref:DUF2059 domain-containing protein n=1 Tax=Piscinibacter koreensis TaxID=2742824 RepID=A0A7Y6NPU0_9BURK|nr:DUF2059 domain-containing protein [Schlegelella koreensis]NUZ07095.1 DUF2059 domain-containing protein [Schlegelella koreensis]